MDPYLLVADVFEGIGHDGDPHVDQVGRSHLKDLLRKLFSILVDFLKVKLEMLKYGGIIRALMNG